MNVFFILRGGSDREEVQEAAILVWGGVVEVLSLIVHGPPVS